MKFDTSEKGLLTLFKPYQAALLEHIWKINNPGRVGITSGQAYEFLKGHPDSKSRASVILFLNEVVEKGVLEEFWFETSGLRLGTGGGAGFNCGLGSYITVYPDGSVYPCHLLAFPEFRLGNVRSQGFLSIYRSSRLLEKLMKLDAEELEPHRTCFKGLPEESKCIGLQAQEVKFREKLLDLLD